jgi:hypothetical protein
MEEGVNEIHEYLSVEKRDFKEPNMTVADLMILNEKRWNVPFIREFFDADSQEKILHTPLLNSIREDKVIWRLENNGMYSVKVLIATVLKSLLTPQVCTKSQSGRYKCKL